MFLRLNENLAINVHEIVRMECKDIPGDGSEGTFYMSDSSRIRITLPNENALTIREILCVAFNLEETGNRSEIHYSTQINELLIGATIKVLP